MTFLAILSTTLFLATCCLLVIVQKGGEDQRAELRATVKWQAAEIQRLRSQTPIYATLIRQRPNLYAIPDFGGGDS